MSLRDIPGEKIRRQYFNIPIYVILSFGTALIMIILIAGSKQDSTQAQEEFWVLASVIATGLLVLLPLIVLSLLNRFFLGEIICVLDKKGIHYKDGDNIRFIPWNHIMRVAYEPDVPMRTSHSRLFRSYNTAHIFSKPFKKEIEIELIQAPFFLLGKMKKYHPNAKYGLTKWGLVLVFLYALAPIIAGLCALLA